MKFKKQVFTKLNPLDWSKTCCCICGFKLGTSLKEGQEKTENLTTWFTFTIQQEHLFLRNIYRHDDLLKMENLKTPEHFYENFEYFLEVVVLLDKCGSKLTNLTDSEDLKTFEYDDFSNVYDAIDNCKIVEKYVDYGNKIIGLAYTHIMDFKKTENIKGAIFSANFLDNVNCLIYSKNAIHRSHITGDITGYAHSH